MAQLGTAESLGQDVTAQFQPTLDYLNQQQNVITNRYETNKADIKNIFGNLSSLTNADAARIKQQFVDTLTGQQSALAARTAEVRQAQQAGQAQQAVTAGERGNGPAPMMGNTAAARAAEQGIARSNQYQTIWEGLQGANQQQALQDIQNRGAGYGQQELQANTALQRGLSNDLSGLAGQYATVQSDMAKAQGASNQRVLNAYYSQAQAATAAERAKGLAAYRASLAAQNRPVTYTNDAVGWSQKAYDYGLNPEVIANAIDRMAAYENTLLEGQTDSSGRPLQASKADIKARWQRTFGNKPEYAFGLDYINKYGNF
jgi:hypothetical protein